MSQMHETQAQVQAQAHAHAQAAAQAQAQAVAQGQQMGQNVQGLVGADPQQRGFADSGIIA